MSTLSLSEQLKYAQNQRFQGMNSGIRDFGAGMVGAAGSLLGGGVIGRKIFEGAGKLLYKSGILDAVTGGGATRFFTGLKNWFRPNVGVKTDYSANVKSVADMVGQGGNMMASYLKKNM